MTYSELNFLLAEANQRNLIATESAKTYYDIAVEASFKQWNKTYAGKLFDYNCPIH
jgi:hypothetical protein